MATGGPPKVIDSHLHVWASPQQKSTHTFRVRSPHCRVMLEFLLECMGEAGVNGALIVQPINHKFDHSYVTSVLKQYPSKFVGCCLANPAEDGNGDGYRGVRFNPYLWPSGQLAMFAKAGELGVPVGFMCMKGLLLHLPEIEQLCTEFPSTIVLLDHMGFCKPPLYPYPYEDLSGILSKVVSSYGANRIMWGSDFPYVVSECGYKEAKEAAHQLIQRASLSSSELEWIMGRTVCQIFNNW
ncbi:hypothetical protein PHJA_002036100 [Phtheirospermum japonicum]|uniref:Amidohydrolase-related domain-containing protein n=1 Tax=Phtheirospermum japonicum TaxID=374723 RepID=A0A830CL16_9LAMI|nr:hypothetical protein PHJA_002036100 [Phtheirospermum japonicum]